MKHFGTYMEPFGKTVIGNTAMLTWKFPRKTEKQN